MKRKPINNILAVLICIALIVLTRLIDALPWWSFVIPVLIFGGVISVLRWGVSGFLTGFLAGFIIWFGVNSFYDAQNGGLMMGRVAQLISVPKLVMLLLSGLLGGLLSGLALYTGKGLLSLKPKHALDDNIDDNSL
ncbi:MAG TPA: hypothetical protein VGB46_02980 [Flavisolibacter sp.]